MNVQCITAKKMTSGRCGKTVARAGARNRGCPYGGRWGGDEKTPLVAAAATAVSCTRVAEKAPPRARCPRNMTDKPAAGGRRWRPRTPDVSGTDAGAPNMSGVRKNGTRIWRPGGVTGEKPSQVCGQSARYDGRAEGRADDRLARNTTWRRAVSRGGRGSGSGEGKWKKITRRNTRPPTGRVRTDVANESRRRSYASRVSPAAAAPVFQFRSSRNNNNILRPVDEILYYYYYYYYLAVVATLPVGDLISEVSFAIYIYYTNDAYIRRCEACAVFRDSADDDLCYIL